MTLFLIGTGLCDAKDLSIKGKETLQKCEKAYLDTYTSILQSSIKELEKEWKTKVIPASREMLEQDSNRIISEAKNKDIAILIIGDVFSATTHIGIFLDALKQGIRVEIIHNASILTAIGITGLEIYKFGQVTSIPFANKQVSAPVKVLRKNKDNNLHTLFLLDLDPKNKQFLSSSDACSYLINKGVSKELEAIACAALGSPNKVIKVGTLEKLQNIKINYFPQCLIIPGKLHFMEEEILSHWKKN